MFLAMEDDLYVGSALGGIDPRRPQTGRVGGMWVAPEVRRRGVGRALLDAVLAWCAERGMDRVELFATEDGTASRRLYEEAGFWYTGRRDPFPHGETRFIVEMVLEAPFSAPRN